MRCPDTTPAVKNRRPGASVAPDRKSPGGSVCRGAPLPAPPPGLGRSAPWPAQVFQTGPFPSPSANLFQSYSNCGKLQSIVHRSSKFFWSTRSWPL